MPKNKLKVVQIAETKTKVTVGRVLILLMIFTAGTTVILALLLFGFNFLKRG